MTTGTQSGSGKPILVSGHARDPWHFRGATEEEIIEAIRTPRWDVAELGRLECRQDFQFGAEWNGVGYATKRVRPICVDAATAIVVVTVYAYDF